MHWLQAALPHLLRPGWPAGIPEEAEAPGEAAAGEAAEGADGPTPGPADRQVPASTSADRFFTPRNSVDASAIWGEASALQAAACGTAGRHRRELSFGQLSASSAHSRRSSTSEPGELPGPRRESWECAVAAGSDAAAPLALGQPGPPPAAEGGGRSASCEEALRQTAGKSRHLPCLKLLFRFSWCKRSSSCQARLPAQ